MSTNVIKCKTLTVILFDNLFACSTKNIKNKMIFQS